MHNALVAAPRNSTRRDLSGFSLAPSLSCVTRVKERERERELESQREREGARESQREREGARESKREKGS
jgi:hypothetical protein